MSNLYVMYEHWLCKHHTHPTLTLNNVQECNLFWIKLKSQIILHFKRGGKIDAF